MNFLFWLLLIVELDVVNGGAGLEDCKETRCSIRGPAIRFPFRLVGSQPEHCGYPGFDLSCTIDHQTVLDMPSSSKLFVGMINYTSQEIRVYSIEKAGCLAREIFYHGSSPFQFVGNASLFSCPPSTGRDQFITSLSFDYYYCLARLSPCHSNPGNQIYAVLTQDDSCNSYNMALLVSCTKVNEYSLALADIYSYSPTLRWSRPSCQHCEATGKACKLKNESTNQIDPQTECFDVPKRMYHLCFKLINDGLIWFICFNNSSHSPYTNFTGHKLGGSTIKVLGFCTLSILLIGIGTMIYYVYSSNKREADQLRVKRFLEDYRELKPSRYSYADIKRITDQFKEKLGQGAYGTVFKGKLSSELLVAVKILNNSNEKGEDFINEVGTMGQIHHVNVVRLVGYCADGFRRALVYEFLPNGPLQNFLSSADNENSFLGWDTLQHIALGIAKGIEYLHQGCEQQILHFDIKPHNVLLDHDFTPKVSDFGLAKLCSKDQSAVSMTAARGTIGYIAPEVYSRNFGNVSYKSDVYSYGKLLLEMVGGRKNFKVMEDSTNQVYFPEWIYNLLEQGSDLRIHIEEEGNVKIARKLAIVGLWCIQWHPMDRPSMKTVVQMLGREGDSLTMPPNPFASALSSN
ncbi:hypothetical protein M0R45_015804 [Rubus argutus]|uniref:Protein kinase domain-containing protein n=1 Tax=Rubus argutus TaxID=59490 RepID=A0AAW1XQM7_RUBAR